MTVYINELGFALPEQDLHSDWIEKTQRLDHDQWLLQIIAKYIKGTIVDIGAHIGTHTVFYASLADLVLAFEPGKTAFECLQHNTKHLKNVKIHNVALGSTKGFVTLNEHPHNIGASQTTKGGMIERIRLDVIPLSACDFIKIDAEGDEVDILYGALDTISYFHPVMLIECNESALDAKNRTPDDLKRLIKKAGYTFNMIHENQLPTHCDLLCIPTKQTR